VVEEFVVEEFVVEEFAVEELWTENRTVICTKIDHRSRFAFKIPLAQFG